MTTAPEWFETVGAEGGPAICGRLESACTRWLTPGRCLLAAIINSSARRLLQAACLISRNAFSVSQVTRDICAGLLALEPGQRFRSYADIQHDIDQSLAGKDAERSPAASGQHPVVHPITERLTIGSRSGIFEVEAVEDHLPVAASSSSAAQPFDIPPRYPKKRSTSS